MTNWKILAAALPALLLPAAAEAATYTKTGPGGSPTVGGELLPSAEVTVGTGDLTEIFGRLNFTQMGAERATVQQSYADLYAITLTGDPFSATTVGQTGNPADPSTDLDNTVLYLFDAHGYGVLSDELDPNSFQPRSTLIYGAPAPGLYYLGIGALGDQPTSSGGLIFPDQSDPTVDPTATSGPTGPGGAAPLSGWDLSSGLDSQAGTYGIALTGVRAAVPESAPLALLGVGLGALLLIARRRPCRRANSSLERNAE